MNLLLGLLFGAVGSGYVIYARRQHDALFFVIGFALIVYPYFIATPLLIVVIGVFLAAIPILHAHGWF
jgi:hypothetical protein